MALIPFVSCTDEMQEMAMEQPQTLKQIVMTTQDFQPEADSRTIYQIADGAVKCTWAENDTVGVFPSEGAQAYFPMVSGAGTKNATFDGKGWALKDGYTYASYYPYIGKAYLDRNAVPVSYTGQTQVGNASMAHLGGYDYMVATPTAPQYGSAQFMFKHLSSLVQLKFKVPQSVTFSSVKLVAETEAFAVHGIVDIMAAMLNITPTTSANEVVLELQDVTTTEEDQVVTFYLMLPPVDLSGQTLTAVITTDKGVQNVVFEGKNFKAGTAYSLSGELNVIYGDYKDGVVSLAEAGTMKKLLGDDYKNITSLKVVGTINGDDVYLLLQMLGDIDFIQQDRGKLTTLDLSEAKIVKGGRWYHETVNKDHYYTSNDVIGTSMFSGCANLQTIVLPNSVTSIGNSAFYGCYSLTSVDIPDSVTSIGNSVFFNCDNLTIVEFPASITKIGSNVFNGNRLKDLYCFAITPPSDYNSFPAYGVNTTLHVPKGSLENYKSSTWGRDYFKTIVEME
jgi:hypothetical protein